MHVDDKPWQPWPADWPARKNGADCVLCTFVQTEDPAWGLKIHTGQVANTYLSTRGQMPGYCWVIWRDGHVCEPTDLDPADAQRFFADMLTVGRVLDQVLQPAKMNYEILGNSVPHLHAHIVPRPQTDPCAWWTAAVDLPRRGAPRSPHGPRARQPAAPPAGRQR